MVLGIEFRDVLQRSHIPSPFDIFKFLNFETGCHYVVKLSRLVIILPQSSRILGLQADIPPAVSPLCLPEESSLTANHTDSIRVSQCWVWLWYLTSLGKWQLIVRGKDWFECISTRENVRTPKEIAGTMKIGISLQNPGKAKEGWQMERGIFLWTVLICH